MQGTDGLQFLAIIRAEYPDFPFVLFTGRGSEEIASEAISAGVTDYMQKEQGTDQYEVLATRIRNAVSRHRFSEQAASAKERAETILEATPNAVFVGIDDRIVYANAAAFDLLAPLSEADVFDSSIPPPYSIRLIRKTPSSKQFKRMKPTSNTNGSSSTRPMGRFRLMVQHDRLLGMTARQSSTYFRTSLIVSGTRNNSNGHTNYLSTRSGLPMSGAGRSIPTRWMCSEWEPLRNLGDR